VIYDWAQQARVLNYTRLERLARDKHSSLLTLRVNCKENIMLRIRLLNGKEKREREKRKREKKKERIERE
jgi:hypothetical protein